VGKLRVAARVIASITYSVWSFDLELWNGTPRFRGPVARNFCGDEEPTEADVYILCWNDGVVLPTAALEASPKMAEAITGMHMPAAMDRLIELLGGAG
jgi:hypothetical protein